MRNFLKVVVFSLVVVAFFGLYSNYGVPGIEPAPPPVEEKLDLGEMTMEQFVALGERIVNGKGTCMLCHNAVGGRAPLLEKLAAAIEPRLADPRYQGEAEDLESYLYESLVEPSAFVVAGFGKKGTGDAESPMPDVSAGSIRLSAAEIKAVMAYLQESNGVEVTVEIPTDVPEEAEGEGEGEPRKPYPTPEDAIAELACGACHKIAGEEGDAGPDLTTVGARRDRDFLRRSILDPNADIAKGFEKDQMPPDYGTQMYAQELEMLVEYLAGLK